MPEKTALLDRACTGCRAIFNLDYALTGSFMRVCAALCALAYILFHFTETAQGYRDWIPLRVGAVVLSILIVVWPASGPLGRWRPAYWEISTGLMLPAGQVFLFLMNPPDAYWTSSQIFWAIFIGIATKPAWLPLHLVVGQFLGLLGYRAIWGGADADKVRILLEQQPIIWTTALFGLTIKVTLEIFHRRGLSLAAANARAAEAEALAAEIKAAHAELERREKVIKRFVRPSLFHELLRGEDPVEFAPVQREMAVMFCDIRDFTRLTEVLSPYETQAFLNQYLSMMTGPILESGGEVDKIIGDCVMGLFPDGRSACRAATGMRLRLQEFNREMHGRGPPPIRNGIGIAKGQVLLGNFGSFEKLDRTVVGEAANIASRLEAKTKMYNLEVVVTEEIIRDLGPDAAHFRWIDQVRMKGSSRCLRLYEVYAHQPDAVRRHKDATRDMVEKALAVYFRKGFRDAGRMFRQLQEQVPPHLWKEGERMDNLLAYYIAHCETWSEASRESFDAVERWDGVHAFQEK